jgi:hypothetical protein
VRKSLFTTKTLILAVLLCVCGMANAGKIEESQWQQGTLVSITTDNHTQASGSIYKGTGSYYQREYVITHYVIDTPEYLRLATNLGPSSEVNSGPLGEV